MSWFGEGLSNLTGQISNFTKEVLAEASNENADSSVTPEVEEAHSKITELELSCSAKDAEITRLVQRNQELESRLKLPQSTPTITTHHPQLLAVTSNSEPSIIEEEQDGWSQFSEEDFPCLQEQGEFSTSTPAATGKIFDSNKVQQQRDNDVELRTKLRDAEARVRELEEERKAAELKTAAWVGPGQETLNSCQDLLNTVFQQNNKDAASKKQALDNLVHQLHTQLKIEDSSQADNEAQKTITLLQTERDTLQATVRQLEQETRDLTQSLEELDEQNQASVDRVLVLKDSLQHEKDSLEVQLEASQAQLQTELTQLDSEICSALRQSLPESVAQEVSEAHSAVVLGRAVARQCADLVWKKEASERKLAEVTREARELRQELGSARSEVSKLREHSERLMAQLSVAGPSGSSGALEPIPEGREEEGDVAIEESPLSNESSAQSNVEALQREADALREARVNLEAEVTTLRTENQSLSTRVRSLGAELRNQENLQREASSMQEKATKLQTQVDAATAYRETLESELSTLRHDISGLREELTSMTDIKKELENSQSSISQITSEKNSIAQKSKSEIDSLKSQLEELSKQNESAVTENQLLEKQLEELMSNSTSNAKLQEEIASLKNEIEKLRTEKEKLYTNLQDQAKHLDINNDEISSLNSKLEEKVSELAMKDEELQDKIRQSEVANLEMKQFYSEKLALLTEEKDSLKLECQNLSETLQQEERQLEDNQIDLEKDTQDKINLGFECQRLQLEVENALAEKLILEQNVKELTTEIEQIRFTVEKEGKQQQEELKSEQKKLKELEDKYKLMETSYQDVIQAAENLENETKKWKSQAELVMNKTEEDDTLIRRLELDISEWKNKAVNIEESYQTTSQGYQEIVKAMESKESLAKKLETEVEKLKSERNKLKELLESKASEYSSLEETLTKIQENQNNNTSNLASINTALSQKCEKLEEKILELNSTLSDTDNQKMELQLKAENLNKLLIEEQKKVQLEVDNFKLISGELKNLESLRLEVFTEHQKLKEELSLVNKKLELVELEKSALEASIKSQSTDSNVDSRLDELMKEKEALVKENQALKQNILELDSIRQQLSTVNAEKINILGVLDEKTRENGSLRNENHRLVALVATEKATSQQLLQEKTQILSRKEFQSSEASEMARESVASLAKIIRDKDQELESLKSKNQSLLTLMQDSNPGLAIHQLFANHPDVELMKSEVNTLQQEKTQLVHSLQQKHQESLQYHAEIQRLSAALSLANRVNQSVAQNTGQEPVSNVAVDVDHLMQSLSQEQQRNKFLQNEVQELSEKESALQGELGRLRQHLVAVEEQYTEEALRGEQLLNELRSALAVAEEKARNTVTSLSSASTRAGQQVELLQEQARVALVQRDEALRRLSAAEDEVRHHTAGLRNLQTVLEQFQRDKERDIELASERLRQQLKQADQRSDQLIADIKALQGQLQEAKEGLSAAARLGVQMDKKSEQITSLKEEVLRLTEQLQQAQGQINSASQSMEGKVDKYLVKNLIVGYFMAAPNNRLEALRIVATVLDFSREERARVGLEGGTVGRGSAAKVGAQTQSLAEAFIRFLENESRPVPQVRMLEEAVGRQRKPSPAPLLMSDVVLPTFAPVPTLPSGSSPSASSSTLKDVLRDS